MTRLINRLANEIESTFRPDFSGHDVYHLKRVMNLALRIQEKEGGDRLVLGAAALLHDIHRLIENETQEYCSPKDSLPRVYAFLDTIEFPRDRRKDVLHCVEFHEEYGFSRKGKTVRDLETRILQDADNLDAMGAIGIGRTFAFAGAHQVSMWVPEKSFNREYYDEGERDPSVLHHFHSKLLKLKDNMNTQTARELAETRHRFMELFVTRFINEWDAKE